ncbi:uncharacterized protein [Chelonus insularis]|uniref:uncharacterized protein isoform X2 n=1 Tax=Chelonus insularis TaxID=460826 RepID=UPI00158AD027|nr:uncharacterized protein LOC118066910 isoform X2 [Chelonus insularis]
MAVKLLLILLLAVVAVSSAGILEARSSVSQSKCLCQTSGCLCCVDLNLTSTIDLGGPACVNIKQKEENISLNLNYGDNPVHNATIKIADAANKPTCMNLLADLAQLCAKFTSIKNQEQSGYDGCLVIEPALMRTPQATYAIGCFNFHQGIVRQIQGFPVESSTENNDSTQEEDEEDEEDDDMGINPGELLAVFSASAKQGIALFSKWLDLNLNPKMNVSNSNKDTVPVAATRQESTNSSSFRHARNMNEKQTMSEENNDERFKQILSAQDNILKTSERIGHSYKARTDYVYVQQPIDHVINQKIINNNSNNLPIVPKESRRGGRAYNIHQHINEV